ncbi:hypothetical protein SLEP1_g24277 [Rubroshorea leprosula]|uniref:XPG-I domain-containing protein n=1 Tax=Rubroshorea leprosula TaxID=152421 RepID=A0AAV5JFE1_9ROSI|nr:hypothetical protein SLEP1_g24277 [Rubroshorea leprosula]
MQLATMLAFLLSMASHTLTQNSTIYSFYSKRVDDAKDLAEAVESGNREDIEKFSKWAVKVTKQHNEDCKRLSRLMGLPMIDALSEVEAQCAALCMLGKVYAVASEDVDPLTFEAP